MAVAFPLPDLNACKSGFHAAVAQVDPGFHLTSMVLQEPARHGATHKGIFV
jgi:hypothetical protein